MSLSRYFLYLASIVLTAFFGWATLRDPSWGWALIVSAGVAAIGTLDLLQKKSTLRRNYPVLAHFRYGLESIGPEMRQYFIESDIAETPFSRQQRALIYQRSKVGARYAPVRHVARRVQRRLRMDQPFAVAGGHSLRRLPHRHRPATARNRIRPASSTSPR